MTTQQLSARRLLVAGGFAVAIAAAPAVAAFASPALAPSFGAACANGETEDVYTNDCTPDLVPNSPVQSSPGGLPSVDGVPCTGGNSGQCIGLSEDAPQYVPPTSSVGSDPTITGSTN
ncbi:intersectin-EH binding protein Ibp1 [Mycobacterium yunnanensis]|uniref:Intersectin-EH binding protein Ibp1 n=1 Tax=Mycobacterium yunnanensis TaxID=368477 RepID=A0A9X2YUH8_9MYCO|nr:intersectin-EH binding protein Ibp1 [Mycobacterium yunnanensis]MCV7419013.1 intersectin-EH binding protein Ibp1 [Mycobacterium yunnanensis]